MVAVGVRALQWVALIAVAPLCLGQGQPVPQTPEDFSVIFDTSEGSFVVDLHRSWAPKGIDRFLQLVQTGYFDDCKFFRAVQDFMAQFGISGRPQLSSQWKDATIEDDPQVASNEKGTLTFAHAGPGTRATQMFINLKDNKYLDSMSFPPVGKVRSGMEVVERLYTGYGEEPMEHNPEMLAEGNAFLQRTYPKLSTLHSVRLSTAPVVEVATTKVPCTNCATGAIGPQGTTAAENLMNLFQQPAAVSTTSVPATLAPNQQQQQVMQLLQQMAGQAAQQLSTPHLQGTPADQMMQLVQVAKHPKNLDMENTQQAAPQGVDVVELAKQWGRLQATKKHQDSSQGSGILGNMMSSLLSNNQPARKSGGMDALTGVMSALAGNGGSAASNPLAGMMGALAGGQGAGGGGGNPMASMMSVLAGGQGAGGGGGNPMASMMSALAGGQGGAGGGNMLQAAMMSAL